MGLLDDELHSSKKEGEELVNKTESNFKKSEDSLDFLILDMEIVPNPPVDPSGYPYPGEIQKTEDMTSGELKSPNHSTPSLKIFNFLDEERRTFEFFYDKFNKEPLPPYYNGYYSFFTNQPDQLRTQEHLFSDVNLTEYEALLRAVEMDHLLSPQDIEALYSDQKTFIEYVDSIKVNSPESFDHIRTLFEYEKAFLETKLSSKEEIDDYLSPSKHYIKSSLFYFQIKENIDSINLIFEFLKDL